MPDGVAKVKDSGLAHEHWQKYFDRDEVSEILNNTTTTMIVSGEYPVHVRIWPQPHAAPTVLIGSSLLGYGLEQARMRLGPDADVDRVLAGDDHRRRCV